MNPYCALSSPRQACEEIGKIAESHVGRLSPRPWNFHDPDTTPWWLVPSSDWPAYAHGKYQFWREGEENEDLICALHVEKGLGSQTADAYPSAQGKRFLMGPEWTWFRFFHDLQNQKVEKVIREIAKGIPFPVGFAVEGGYVPDPGSFDPLSSDFKRDSYFFEWSSGSEEFQVVESNEEARVLKVLRKVKTFNDLNSALDSLAQNDWLWMDVFVCLRLRVLLREMSSDERALFWNPRKIWTDFLCHFRPWVI